MRYVVVYEVKPMSTRLKAAFIALAIAILVVGAQVISTNFLGMNLGGSEAGPKVQVAADQFKPASEWKLKKEEIHPAALSCTGPSCPSVYRVWDIGSEQLSGDAVKELIKSAGYAEATNPQCSTSESTGNRNSVILECKTTTANGVISVLVKETRPQYTGDALSGYLVSLYVSK